MTVVSQVHRETIEGVEYKVCTKCQTLKPLSDYHVQSSAPDGHHYSCKHCIKVIYRRPPRIPKKLEWALQNPNTERGREWLVKHGVKHPQLVAMVKPADLDIPWLYQYEAQKEQQSAITHRFQTGGKCRNQPID